MVVEMVVDRYSDVALALVLELEVSNRVSVAMSSDAVSSVDGCRFETKHGIN